MEDEEGEPESLAVPPSSIKAKQAREQKERKEKKLPGTSLLSFGDDEEAHSPALVREKAKAKASGVRAAPVPSLASASGTTATQISAPGGDQQSSYTLQRMLAAMAYFAHYRG